MNTYTYTDFRSNVIVFVCQATNILEADRQYKAAIGTDVVKQPHIGCQIEFNS
jgi:hypothetical protein